MSSLLLSLSLLLASCASWSVMSFIMDELVRAVRTAAPCRRSALARRAENVLSLYCLCRVATQVVLSVFVSIVCSGRLGRSACLRGIITHEVLEVLEEESFFLKPAKCKFEQESIDYLGIVVTKGTVRINPTKQNRLAAWPRRLTSMKQVRSTLGVLGYQRPFICRFAQLA
jgi:hypothetical protein